MAHVVLAHRRQPGQELVGLHRRRLADHCGSARICHLDRQGRRGARGLL
jgi:hypothetical protein